ncbi:hypothetical protein U0035_15930 [Niabella yanshanensis]|uniref:Uncharacterized protein n=1 Tax=Niabella yanshanensis TaxID=577386 RepID=A0ABZ0W1L7_9BACT|nr:hypothetical protein [Niabella yanshanensis]WQD37160.1 hypothetical protein U0035_15930 [Niabella yanshanensis]
MKAVKIIVLACFLSLGLNAIGQSKEAKLKPWVCSNGFWVVETNVKTPLFNKVRFYTNNGLLMEEKEINGARLNVKKRKVKIELKQMLEAVALAWEQQHKSEWVKRY